MTQNTAAVIQAITSIVNLIFVGGIFIFERRTSKKNVNDEKKEFWYRQTLLSRGLDLTGECFDTMEQLLRSSEEFINGCTPENEKKIKEIIGKIQRQIYILRNGVVSYAKLFDTTLFKQLKEEAERLEDGITQGIESCYLAAGNNTKIANKSIETELSNLQKHRYTIVSKLYDYDTKA